MTTLCERLRAATPDSPAYGELYGLVQKTAAALARARRIVPPHGGAWQPEDIEDLVGEFFAKEGVVEDLVANPANDDRLKQRIAAALQRVRSDDFRLTPLGALRRRIDRRMKHRDDVVDVAPKHWALTAHAGHDHWAGGPAPLEAAAGSIPIADPPPHPWDSKNQPQATDVASLDAVTTAVLDTAAAPVAQPDLKRVVCDRILPAGQQTEPITDSDNPEVQHADPSAALGAGAAVASAVWETLTDDDRRLVLGLEAGGRELASEGFLGPVGKTAVYDRQSNLEAKLKPFVEDFDDALEFARCLLVLATEWAAAQVAGHNEGVAP
jgi:hypothetical protein